MDAKLIYRRSQPYFLINGIEYDPVAFMTYAPDPDRNREMRENGMKFFSFTVYVGDRGINEYCNVGPFSRGFYLGHGRYDFTDVDRMLDYAAPGGKGALIFPRVFVDAPNWWYRENPDDRCLDQTGTPHRQCFASEKWRADMKEALKALIDHIRQSVWAECVFCYHIAFGGTEECVYQMTNPGMDVDYSPLNLAKYRVWLQNRYGTVEALRTAWKDTEWRDAASFDEIAFPTPAERNLSLGGAVRDLHREAHVIDFYRYNSFLIADTLLCFCRFVKEYTRNSVLTGAFYGYIFILSNQDKGHNDIRDLLRSPYIDFLSCTGGGFGLFSPNDSYRLHGKLWFSEGDIRTCQSSRLGDSLPHALPPSNNYYEGPAWNGPPTMELSVAALRRGAYRVLTLHSGIWFFDMWGNWFRSPEMMREIGMLEGLMKEQTDGPMETDAAVILDEEGLLMYGGALSEDLKYATQAQRGELSRMGTTYHCYLADDLDEADFDPDRYRIYFIIGAISPGERARRGIERLKANGRTLVWLPFSDIENTGLSDFRIRYSLHDRPMQADAVIHTAKERYGHVVYPDKPLSCPRFSEGDLAEGYPAAYLRDGETVTSEPALLWKKKKGYNAVYSLLPALPCALLRELLCFAGAHVYNQTDDWVFNGGRYVGLGAISGGQKRLIFPCEVRTVTDVNSGEIMRCGEKFVDFICRDQEVRLFRIETE